MKFMVFVLCCFAFANSNFAAEERSEWDLENPCPNTCHQSGKKLSYRELLSKAPLYIGFQKDWDIVNRGINLFSKPIESKDQFNNQITGPKFSSTDLSLFQEARASLLNSFFVYCKGGLPGTCRNRYSSDSLNAEHDFSYALEIVYANICDNISL